VGSFTCGWHLAVLVGGASTGRRLTVVSCEARLLEVNTVNAAAAINRIRTIKP
jgi:hypothetical protein